MSLPDNEEAVPNADQSAASSMDNNQRKLAFRTLFFCQLTVGMGQTLIFAVMPPLARQIGMSEFQTTMLYAVAAFIWMFSGPFWGRRSDMIGRKPVVLTGVLAFGASIFFFALVVIAAQWGWWSVAVTFPLLLISRSVFGTFGSGIGTASQAYIADRTTRIERTSAVASLGAAFGLGTALGPGVAGAFSQIHILAPFFAVALAAFVAGGCVWFFLPEQFRPSHYVSDKAAHAKFSWRHPSVLPWICIAIIVSITQMGLMQLCAFYFMDTLHIEGDQATQMVSVGLLSMAVAALFAQVGLIHRFKLSVVFLLRWGAAATILSLLMMAVGNSYGLLVAALTMGGIGFGLLRPGVLAGASLSVSKHNQGSVAGIINGMAAVGAIVNPFLGIPLYHWHHSAPFIAGALLGALILAFAFLHPMMKELDLAAEKFEDEEDGLGGLG